MRPRLSRLRAAVVPVTLLAVAIASLWQRQADVRAEALEVISRRALEDGVLPLWNPYQFGGRPHLADSQTLTLYPPHLLLRVLPLEWFSPVSFALHAWVAGLGAYLLWRQFAASRAAAFAGSLAILFGTVLAPLPGGTYSPVVYPLAWLPLVAALALRAATTGAQPSWTLIAAALMGALSGPLRAAVYVVGTIAACYAAAAIRTGARDSRRRRLLAHAVSVIAVVFGLGAFQLLPAVDFWASSLPVGGRSAGRPASEPRHGRSDDGGLDAMLAQALSSGGRRGRIISACADVVDAKRLADAGVPTVGGGEGALLADYARTLNIASGRETETPTDYQGVAAFGQARARTDILRLLNVTHMVSCEKADTADWIEAGELADGVVYRFANPLPRAFWTCAPVAVSRAELDHRLRAYRYDERLELRPRHFVHVRWANTVDEHRRRRLEAQFRLVEERYLGDDTWRYELLDSSHGNIAAIVTDPAVEDTAGIDRGTFALLPPPPVSLPEEPASEWLMGATPCDPPQPAVVLTRDRPDGRVVLRVEAPRDGLVFLSETFDPARAAFVDGRRVETRKVNFAFTGIPVPAGVHRVELRYDARALYTGTWISCATLIVGLVISWRSRRDGRHDKVPDDSLR